jgi:hypothetical protein
MAYGHVGHWIRARVGPGIRWASRTTTQMATARWGVTDSMDTRSDAVASPRATDVHEPAVAAKRSGLEFIPYGIAMGSVATALGAMAAERWGGMTRVVVWITVTTIIAVGAVFVAEPGLAILGRFFRTIRNQ